MIQINNIRTARLNEDSHTYSDDNGVTARLSISAIAQRGAVLPDMKHIKDAAKVGTKIHALLHKIIQGSIDGEGVIDFNKCLERAQSTVLDPQDSLICCYYIHTLIGFRLKNPKALSEQSLIADFNGVPVGGTADLIIMDGEDTYIIDFKTAKMSGFKKEYHLQLYGYSLFRPEIGKFKCYVLHPDGIRPLFEDRIPEWIIAEFEDNFNYMLTKDQPKQKVKINHGSLDSIKEIARAIDEFDAVKTSLSAQIREIEKQKQACIDKMEYLMGDVFTAYDNFETVDGDIVFDKVKVRRHTISYCPEIEKYYDCSISNEYHLTIEGKKVKIKVKGGENE